MVCLILKSVLENQTLHGLIPGFLALIEPSLHKLIATPKTTVFGTIKSFMASPPGAAEALENYFYVRNSWRKTDTE
jgi:hypothetical protein